MGLGRKTMQELYKKYDDLKIDEGSLEAKRIEYLFYSIKGTK